MAKITIVGAGSISFAGRFIRDLCLTGSLAGHTVVLMDRDGNRLETVLEVANRTKAATKAKVRFLATTDRKAALKGADFVVCAVKVGGYAGMEAERAIEARHGFPGGIGDRVSDYYGGIGAYYQLRFFLELAREMEALCPEATLIETANPVFEGTTLVHRTTGIRVIGVCHGHFATWQIATALGFNLDQVGAEVAGFNHCIWLTHFRYRGQDAYPQIDEWIQKKSAKYWKSDEYRESPAWGVEQLSPGAVDMYRTFGLFPIGDTVRSVSPWWYHTDLKTKKKWYGPTGGFDSEIGWSCYLDLHREGQKAMQEMAGDPSISVTTLFPLTPSGEQHIPIIDAMLNDKPVTLQLNIPNRGSIRGIPDDVAVEIPAVVSGRGAQGIQVGELPRRLILNILAPRMQRMEQILQAFLDGDRQALLLTIMDDRRSRSLEKANAMIEELLSQPWNEAAARHYRWK